MPVEKSIRVIFRRKRSIKHLDALLPILISSELSERLSKLTTAESQIYIKNINIPIPGIETGDRVFDARLELYSEKELKALESSVREIIREISRSYQVYFRTFSN